MELDFGLPIAKEILTQNVPRVQSLSLLFFSIPLLSTTEKFPVCDRLFLLRLRDVSYLLSEETAAIRSLFKTGINLLESTVTSVQKIKSPGITMTKQ